MSVGPALRPPVTQDGVQAKNVAIIAASEELIDDLHEAGRLAAQAEADWKAARARSLLMSKGAKDPATNKPLSAEERDAKALLDNEDLFRAYLASAKRFEVLRESNDALDRMMHGVQSLGADLRPHVSEVRR